MYIIEHLWGFVSSRVISFLASGLDGVGLIMGASGILVV